jgi:hypothetical protein
MNTAPAWPVHRPTRCTSALRALAQGDFQPIDLTPQDISRIADLVTTSTDLLNGQAVAGQCRQVCARAGFEREPAGVGSVSAG